MLALARRSRAWGSRNQNVMKPAQQATEDSNVIHKSPLPYCVRNKERAPLITNTLRPRLHEYLGGTVRGLGGTAIEINGTNDHVHILAKLRLRNS